MSNRPIKVVLGDALDELREREKALVRFAEELADVRKALKVLERAVETDVHPRATKVNPPGEAKAKILAVVAASLEPVTTAQIADLIGREPGAWLSMLCKKLVGAGELVEVTPGRYGLSSALRTQGEAA